MFVAGRDAEYANFGVIPAKAGLGGRTGRRANLLCYAGIVRRADDDVGGAARPCGEGNSFR